MLDILHIIPQHVNLPLSEPPSKTYQESKSCHCFQLRQSVLLSDVHIVSNLGTDRGGNVGISKLRFLLNIVCTPFFSSLVIVKNSRPTSGKFLFSEDSLAKSSFYFPSPSTFRLIDFPSHSILLPYIFRKIMAPTTPIKQDSQSETTSSRTLLGDNNESDSSQPQNPGAVAATTNNGGRNQPQADHPDVPEDEDEQMQDIVGPSSLTEDITPRKSVAPPQSGDKKKFSKSSAVFSQRSSRYESPSPPSVQVPRHQQQHSSSSHAVNTHDTIAASDRRDDDPDSRRSDVANSTSTAAMQEEAPQPVAPPVTGEEGEAGDEERQMDWDDLERRFEAEMEACRENERKLREEWDRWVEVRPLSMFCDSLDGRRG